MADEDPENVRSKTDQVMAALFGIGPAAASPAYAAENTIADLVAFNPAHNLLPAGPSSGSCRYNGLKANPNRKIPDSLKKEIRVGDIVVFEGNHIQMCTAIKNGEPEWCSDTVQGANFFCNAQCQQGEYVIYRPGANFDKERAARMLREHAERNANYTGQCAAYVRQDGIEAGLDHGIARTQPNASDYNKTGVLEKEGFTVMGHGRGDDFRPTTSAIASASPRATRPGLVAAAAS